MITDVDNTLYDWLSFYIPSFQAMVQELQRISGVDAASLMAAFQKVHQAHGTTEYAFAIQELDVLARIEPGLTPAETLRKYDSAIHAFRSMRKKTLRLYPGVRDVLERLKARGIPVVAHSDSMISYVSRRLRQLDVDQLLAGICAPRDHGVPTTLDAGLVRRAPQHAVHSRTRHLEFTPGLRKPDSATLTPIFEHMRFERDEVLYVGDSLSRDVLLARRAGLTEVWARYGAQHEDSLYRQLLAITYWTEAEVAEEERLRRELGSSAPAQAIDSFSELLGLCGLA